MGQPEVLTGREAAREAPREAARERLHSEAVQAPIGVIALVPDNLQARRETHKLWGAG